MEYLESERESLENRKDLEEHEEYEKYKTDLEEKGLDYCEGLRYIAIQEAKKALKVYENHVEMMDEKLDEWEQGERK